MPAQINDHTESFEAHRPLLFSIAYRMLGSAMEAEDMVQETYLRYIATPLETINSPKAFLSTVTTRLCLNHLKSARVKREEYPGPWLPEPLITGEGATTLVNKYEMISMAALVLLEKLSPVERAVFVLRSVFDYSYPEIAQIVEKSETNCRQYYRRAKQHLTQGRPRFEASPATQEKLITGFLGAVQTGDLDTLTNLLAEDVVLWSDGGGKVAAAARPLFGRDIVARLMITSYPKRPEGLRMETAEINGALSLLLRLEDKEDKIIGVINFAGDDRYIHEIRAVWNPEKLEYLHQVGQGRVWHKRE